MHSSPAVPGRQAAVAPVLWWLCDTLIAALFAAGLALALPAVIAGDGARLALGAALMLLSGPLRARAQVEAASAGLRSAVAWKQQTRQRLWPALLATTVRRSGAVGTDLHLAVDTVEAVEGHRARFLPLRQAAVAAPLLAAGLVALASPVSALILGATLLPFAFGMALAGTAAARAAERQLVALARLSGLFVDRLRALPAIRLAGAERMVCRQIGTATADVARRTLGVLKIALISNAVLEFFAALAVALVAVYCGFSLLGLLPFPAPEHLGAGQAFFALVMAPEFYLPMRRLAAAYHDRQQGEAAMQAIAAVPAAPPPEPVVEQFEGIVAHRLCVSPGAGRTIGPVNFALGARGLLVIEGPTGAGKSSLLHAVAGLLPVASGEIGWAAGAACPIGWAGQRVLLLPGTLEQAIALGRPDAGRDAIMDAAERAGLGAVIATRGLDARLDHRGSGLSGGERRRIGLARALLSARPLLLLDEPTADLDPSTAAAVRAAIRAEAGRRAVLAASHDGALMALADAVVRLP
jgi:ATP-binding cassette subfamily C protein CydD